MANTAAVELARAYLSRFLVIHAQRRRAQPSAFGPSRDEIAEVLTGPRPIADPAAAEQARVVAAERDFDTAIAARPEPLLARLARVFSLTPLDLRIICVLIAPELDHELERAYTFALDDFTRKRPDIGFVARVIAPTDRARADEILTRFDEAAPLRLHGILTVASTGDVSASMRTVRVADRIVAFLRGHDTLDELVHGFVRIVDHPPRLADVILNPELLARIARAIESRGPLRLLLAGPEGTGRAMAVSALYGATGRVVLRIDLAAIVADGRIAERLGAALREAALRDAVAILEGGTALDGDVPRALVHALATASVGLAVPIIFAFSGHPAWLVQATADLVELDVPGPTFRERLALWKRALPEPLAAHADLETVAARYAFTGAAISRAAARAANTALLRDPEKPRVSLDDLGDSARLMFSHRLGALAQRIPTGFVWDDLVLPRDTLEALKEVTRFARYRPFLLEDWGFAAKLPYGRGVSAILVGPPGTGKTMVAQLLAHELGYDLYRIDLSQVVNKYIGETEKNLARIFDEAENSHAILFFDEADSLFAKRTNVQSANDRYANLEVNYLLQRMETYDGVTLLATNLEQGIDEAFKRRVRFTVQFELPEEAERSRLWRSMFPALVPLAPDIDWDLLGKRFEMAGGYIKKAVLRAALMAAETQRPITTSDLVEAARHEYREMGRII